MFVWTVLTAPFTIRCPILDNHPAFDICVTAKIKRKLSRWIREYNNIGMKPLNWKSPNQVLEEYKKLTAEK